ncbi:MAG: 50S ribosomal protein L5 [Nanoarchaeota archaeon]|nr:50S ribosomal protein L5 [Nanoarchaeota archaeon]MBU1269140.1 50S ribosomal protein L5 [Nanoarchaeota archaeon]MBU1605102.1 50S ribosomal protein L5 [Nanoarchaeota archaeon]MBU2442783.1 50S ribosomal protein L5 [Nanoarchaeota archaeon]
MNPMKEVRIEKLTLNIGAGKDQTKLKKAEKLLKQITGINPVKTITQKRIAGWGLRPGLPIGCKITLRKGDAKAVLVRLLKAKENRLSPNSIDDYGNISFGIHEYIDIPEAKYDPEIGIIGLQTSLTLERPGFRIKKRKLVKRKISHKHRISKEDAIEFLKKEFKVSIGEKE